MIGRASLALLAASACGSDASGVPAETSSSASAVTRLPPRREPPPPSSADPFPEASAPFMAHGDLGPAPATEPSAKREQAVLDLLEGKRSVDGAPEVATEGGAPLDPTLRNKLAPYSSAPQVRSGKVEAGPGLPPEIISRIVRQNFGRFRLCYEKALARTPDVAGRIEVRFTIDETGALGTPTVGGDLPDAEMKECVRKAVIGLSFPQPDPPRPLNVKLPLTFSPPD